MGAWKTVRAEDKGSLSAFAAHPYAPLLATASFSQNSQALASCVPPGFVCSARLSFLVPGRLGLPWWAKQLALEPGCSVVL